MTDNIDASGSYALRVEGSGFVPPGNVEFNRVIRYRAGIGFRTD